MHIHPNRLALLVAVALAMPVAAATEAASPDRLALPATAPLDLPAALRLALEQPALRAAVHEVAASQAIVGQAGSLPNPTLEYLREGQQAGTRTTTVQINQPIELGGKRRARIALAEGAATLAGSELAALRQQIRADVIAAYYAVLVARERQALAQASIELARQGVEIAAKRVAAGKISPIDETKARLAAVDAATELNAADAELAVARTEFGALVGRPPEAVVLVPGDAERLPDLKPLATMTARAQAADAAPVRRARSELAARQAQLGVERAARIPDVTLSVGAQREDEVGRRQAVIGLSVPLPLFDRNQGNLTAALRRTDKARDELAAAETSAAAALTAAHARYAQARSEAALLRQDVIPHAQSAYELTLRGFEYGKFAFLDVLDARRTWLQAQARRWSATLAAWRAYADIERLAGSAGATEHDLREQP